MKKTLIMFGTFVMLSGVMTPAHSQHTIDDRGHSGHNVAHGATDLLEPTPSVPNEPGQGAFASMAEIVMMLRADQATDWQVVNLDALRDHLVDMNALVLRTIAKSESIQDGLAIQLDRTLPSNTAAERMVIAHAPVLQAETGWNSIIEINDDEIVWTVTSEKDATQIRSLGFFGLMAMGDHHREHHLAIAKGGLGH